jgi:hypothetical protein
MRIVFAGCSITKGAELTDFSMSYASLISKLLNANEINISQSGVSNEIICKTIFEFFSRSNAEFAVIQVTSILRFTFVYNDEYTSIVPGLQFYKPDPLIQSLKKHVYSSNTDNSRWYRLSRWKLLCIHHYLNSLGVKHIFTFKDEEDLNMFIEDDLVPEGFKERCCNRGLIDYCKAEKLELGPKGHPLENAHKQIAKQIILPKMKELL